VIAQNSGLTLDTGALIAIERGVPRIRALLRRAEERGIELAVPAGVVAQAWRGGARQARIARLLADSAVVVPVLDELVARAVGVLCGRTGHVDIVDVQVALHARENGHLVVTSDPTDMQAIDPQLRLIVI
jgi:predicted nucleic acid-binding protein